MWVDVNFETDSFICLLKEGGIDLVSGLFSMDSFSPFWSGTYRKLKSRSHVANCRPVRISGWTCPLAVPRRVMVSLITPSFVDKSFNTLVRNHLLFGQQSLTIPPTDSLSDYLTNDNECLHIVVVLYKVSKINLVQIFSHGI